MIHPLKHLKARLIHTLRKCMVGVFRESLPDLVDDVRIRDAMWFLANKRPPNEGANLVYLPGDMQKRMYEIATDKSARFMFEKHPAAKPHLTADTLLHACVERALKAERKGLFLEFGVFQGRTITNIANAVKSAGITVHGFDSFRGLPEDWNDTARKGLFDLGGKLPPVPDNVQLHVGWFDATLADFAKNHAGPVAFLHIDSDLYSSAKTVLTGLKDRIGAGCVILFDEFLNYPTYEEHEFKAFHEFIAETGKTCECLGYDTCGFAVGFQIK